ncbi:MAG: hypothetical protein M3460_29560 [Actinomycetota bacterium]|nr:hypothetical protein [Actinomycetota bacterium]
MCLRLLYLIMVCLFRWLAVLACSKSAVATEVLYCGTKSRSCVAKSVGFQKSVTYAEQ